MGKDTGLGEQLEKQLKILTLIESLVEVRHDFVDVKKSTEVACYWRSPNKDVE